MSSYGNGGGARDKVNAPAIALLITGILNVLVSLYGIVRSLMVQGGNRAQLQQMGFPPERIEMIEKVSGPFGAAIYGLTLIIGIVIIVGALKMKRLESYRLAMTSNILAMIPCVSCCCVLGLPFGIWGLIVLNKPEVRQAFH